MWCGQQALKHSTARQHRGYVQVSHTSKCLEIGVPADTPLSRTRTLLAAHSCGDTHSVCFTKFQADSPPSNTKENTHLGVRRVCCDCFGGVGNSRAILLDFDVRKRPVGKQHGTHCAVGLQIYRLRVQLHSSCIVLLCGCVWRVGEGSVWGFRVWCGVW